MCLQPSGPSGVKDSSLHDFFFFFFLQRGFSVYVAPPPPARCAESACLWEKIQNLTSRKSAPWPSPLQLHHHTELKEAGKYKTTRGYHHNAAAAAAATCWDAQPEHRLSGGPGVWTTNKGHCYAGKAYLGCWHGQNHWWEKQGAGALKGDFLPMVGPLGFSGFV